MYTTARQSTLRRSPTTDSQTQDSQAQTLLDASAATELTGSRRLALGLVAGTLMLYGFSGLGVVGYASDDVEVRLRLPVRSKIDMTNRRTVLPAPFIMVSQEGDGSFRGADLDVRREFERYLHKVLRRETDLKVTEPGPVDYPSYDLEMLSREPAFWQTLGERSGADLILVGSLDFDIQDRSGYKTEEYISPFNGQTYYRQVLVEQTGFEYDIVVQVYDGQNGGLLYTDNFKDFKAFETERSNPLRGMFENLRNLESRIVNIFAQKKVEASRVLLKF